MKKQILIGIVLIFLIGIVSAEIQPSYYYKYGEDVVINRECFIEGDYCDLGFNCSLTVFHANTTAIINNTLMTWHSTYYNLTFVTLIDNGLYRASMMCTNSTSHGSNIFYFQVNPTGDERGIEIPLTLLIVSFVLFFLGTRLENNIFIFLSAILFCATGMYMLIYGFGQIFNEYTRIISGVLIGIGLITILISVLDLIKESEYN